MDNQTLAQFLTQKSQGGTSSLGQIKGLTGKTGSSVLAGNGDFNQVLQMLQKNEKGSESLKSGNNLQGNLQQGTGLKSNTTYLNILSSQQLQDVIAGGGNKITADLKDILSSLENGKLSEGGQQSNPFSKFLGQTGLQKAGFEDPGLLNQITVQNFETVKALNDIESFLETKLQSSGEPDKAINALLNIVKGKGTDADFKIAANFLTQNTNNTHQFGEEQTGQDVLAGLLAGIEPGEKGSPGIEKGSADINVLLEELKQQGGEGAEALQLALAGVLNTQGLPGGGTKTLARASDGSPLGKFDLIRLIEKNLGKPLQPGLKGQGSNPSLLENPLGSTSVKQSGNTLFSSQMQSSASFQSIVNSLWNTQGIWSTASSDLNATDFELSQRNQFYQADAPKIAPGPLGGQGASNPVVNSAQAAGYSNPASQTVAAQVAKAAGQNNAQRSIMLQLNPPDLGRVNIQMQLTANNTLKTRIVVEKAETLQMLQRDIQTLEKALEEAGIKDGGENLEFSLSEDGTEFERNNNSSNTPNDQNTSDDEHEQEVVLETKMGWFVDMETGLPRYDIVV